MREGRRTNPDQTRGRAWRLLSGWSLICGLLIIAGGCADQPRPTGAAANAIREYNLQGRVETIDLNRKRAIIAHEEIPGYMKPMTMGFSIPDEKALQSLRAGDRIEARLVVDPRTNLTWLEGVRVIAAPVTEAPAGAGRPPSVP